jgi:hypothetical protein
MNLERARRLIAAGKMTEAGLRKIGGQLRRGFRPAPDIIAAIRADEAAWRNFRTFPEYYRRIRVAFVEGARNRPEMFRKRIRYLVSMSRKNKRYGMVK